MGIEHLIPAKKGEIRNRKGRGKGVKNASTYLRKYFDIKIRAKELGVDIPIEKLENRKLTIEELMDLKMMYQVLTEGDVKAYIALKDRRYGLLARKVKKQINKTEQKLNVSLNFDEEKMARILKLMSENETIIESVNSGALQKNRNTESITEN